jgi:hypothetical protein
MICKGLKMGDMMNMVCAALNQRKQNIDINQRMQAVQKLLHGNAEENAGVIFEIIATRHGLNDEEAAAAVRSLLRREEGGSVFNGQAKTRRGKSKRVAPIIESAASAMDENGQFAAIAIDFVEPDSDMKVKEIARFGLTKRGQDLISRAETLVLALDLLRAMSGDAIAERNNVSRREGYNIKERECDRLENELTRLRTHFEWAMENGLTGLSSGTEKTSAKDFFDRAIQAVFDFDLGE